MDAINFFSELLKKNKRIIARAISYVESEYPQAEEILKKVHQYSGKAYRIGVTGPPGAGKSTITNHLAKLYLQEGKSVAIIAVDPTSPFTGGALLGDRVRMSDIGKNE
ncbi:MAG: P-loop NTPase fold protein, partial [Ignavibacteriaceae bacterium]